jgi:MFS family permease
VFWAGFVITNVSTFMQTFALGWLVVQLAVADGSPERAPLDLGLVAVARAVPGLALGLLGGVFADRRDRRGLLLATQVSFAALGTALAVLALTGLVSLPWVLALSALLAVTSSFYHPTRIALVPRLVGDANIMSAFGLNSLALNIGALVGPIVGGALVGPLSVGGVLLASACLYAISALIYLRLPSQAAATDARRTRVFVALAEGLRYVRDDPTVRWLMLLFAVMALVARPYLDLLPAFAGAIGTDAVGLAQMSACAGLGSLFAGLLTASTRAIRRKGLIVVIGVIATGVTLAILGLQRELATSLLVVVALSFFLMTASGMVGGVLQLETPDAMRGRVIGVQSLLLEGGLPLGGLAVGSLGTAVGIGSAFAAVGALLAVVGLGALIFVPSLRQSGRTHAVATPVRDSAHA